MFAKQILNKPEYIFRPLQAWRRARHHRSASVFAQARLPWGVNIRFHPEDTIGASILRMGLYDLCVCEVLWRLLDPGEHALDVGANIGQMTSVMAVRCGAQGSVTAFEPHPDVFTELRNNVLDWQQKPGIAQVTLMPIALSNKSGTAILNIPTEFNANRGTASLTEMTTQREGQCAYSVRTACLDDIEGSGQPINLLKIDVEGHELAVLEGAVRCLKQRAIRDIVFEEHTSYPTPVTRLLESQGYTLFMIHKGLLRPIVTSPDDRRAHNPYDPPNFLATCNPERALKRLRGLGWAVLRTRKP